MQSFSVFAYVPLYLTIILTSPIVTNVFTTAYILPSPNAISAHHPPTSALASKVIYESPPLDNVYKEFLVTSKPVTLRKYGHGSKKTKKTKKDSKIYFIPMPPMPYRFVPGVGYDYQPVKIKPIIVEGPTTNAPHKNYKPTKHEDSIGYKVSQHSQHATETTPQKGQDHAQSMTTTVAPKDSKIVRLELIKHGFNGRPLRIQVARAQRKHRLTPQNIKSKLYFNKKVIN